MISCLGQRDQRRMNLQRLPPLHARPGLQICHPLKGLDELRPAIRIAAVVQRIHSDKNIADPKFSAQASANDRKIVLRAGT